MSDELHQAIDRAREAQGDTPETYEVPEVAEGAARCYYCGRAVDVGLSPHRRVTAWEAFGTLVLIEVIADAYACQACIDKRVDNEAASQQESLPL